MQRRKFIKQATILAGGVLLKGPNNSLINSGSTSNLIKIDEPFHGAILNYHHGVKTDGGLKIKVRGEAPLGSKVSVNGITAIRNGAKYEAEVVLREAETDITAKVEGLFGQNSQSVRVVWDKNSIPRYRVVINNNIFFLRDIAWNNYDSLFDSFFLKRLQELNQKYGTKFILNIFYTDGLEFTSVDAEEFELTQFSDKYKKEWEDNSDWLKLAFNGYSNKPDRPYQFAEPKKLIQDLNKVKEQILRFAGPKTYTPPVAVHWAMAQQSAIPELAKEGTTNLSGKFGLVNGKWDINYLLDDIQSEHISRNDALMDFKSNIAYIKMDLTINNTPINEIEPALKELADNPYRSEIMNIFTHEQYFWPFYINYIPDHFDRVETAVRWLTENKYKPVLFSEGFLA